MRIGIIGKYPPIQGGVSVQNYWLARYLAKLGHEIHVITNANEVEPGFRINLAPHPLDLPTEPNVTVWTTETFTDEYRYIPEANPFVSKLAARLADVVEDTGIEVIYAYYYEPYAVAAWMASSWTEVPYVVRHAGSDIGRLIRTRDLHRTHVEVLRRASLVIASPNSKKYLISIGVPQDRIHPNPGLLFPWELFSPEGPKLDRSSLVNPNADPSLPLVGIYGKIGETKGIFDLLKALAHLKEKGQRFHIVAACHSYQKQEERFETLVDSLRLRDDVLRIDFIPHWRIPALIRAVDVVCFLEQGFPIKHHMPRIPTEVLSCGTCLVVSSEVARKQLYCEKMIHGHNVFIVRHPEDIEELAGVMSSVLTDIEQTREIGTKGVQTVVRDDNCLNRHIEILELARNSVPKWSGRLGLFKILKEELPEPWRLYFPISDKLFGEALRSVIKEIQDKDISSDNAWVIFENFKNRWEERDPLLEILKWEAAQVPLPFDEGASDALFFRQISRTILSGNKPFRRMRPILANNILLEAFRFDMKVLYKLVKAGDDIKKSKESTHFYAFQSTHGSIGRTYARIVEVTPWIFLFLNECNGQKNVLEIARKIDITDGEGPWLEAVRHLWQEGLIY